MTQPKDRLPDLGVLSRSQQKTFLGLFQKAQQSSIHPEYQRPTLKERITLILFTNLSLCLDKSKLTPAELERFFELQEKHTRVHWYSRPATKLLWQSEQAELGALRAKAREDSPVVVL